MQLFPWSFVFISSILGKFWTNYANQENVKQQVHRTWEFEKYQQQQNASKLKFPLKSADK